MQSLQGGASRLSQCRNLYYAWLWTGWQRGLQELFADGQLFMLFGKLRSRLESTPTVVVYSHSKESIVDVKGLALGWLSWNDDQCTWWWWSHQWKWCPIDWSALWGKWTYWWRQGAFTILRAFVDLQQLLLGRWGGHFLDFKPEQCEVCCGAIWRGHLLARLPAQIGHLPAANPTLPSFSSKSKIAQEGKMNRWNTWPPCCDPMLPWSPWISHFQPYWRKNNQDRVECVETSFTSLWSNTFLGALNLRVRVFDNRGETNVGDHWGHPPT